jgi:plasmid replication initiation protein
MAKSKKKGNKGIILIKKANNLVESKYKFDIWETRFFLSVLANIRREDTDAEVYRIRYKDIIKIFSLKSGDSYALLRDAAKALMSKSVQINYEENGIERTKEVHLIGTIDYLREGHRKVADIGNHEYIDVTIQQEMRPFLLQLSKNFTAYDLRNITKLSVYAIRLYELLKQYETFGVRTLSIDEMKAMFQVEEQYALYADFYRWVIKPSEGEINKHTDLTIMDVEKLKEGRKVVALRFKFRAKTAQELTKLRGGPLQETLFDSLSSPQIVEISAEMPEKVKVVVLTEKAVEEQKKAVNEQGKAVENKGKERIVATIEDAEIVENSLENNPESNPDSNAQDKLIFELSPIVVTQFGVSFKVFMGLIEQYTEGVIRQAVAVTQKAVQVGKVGNVAGFFVEAVRGNYTDPKQQKKQAEATQKAKIADAKKLEAAAEMAVKTQKQLAYARDIELFTQLIQEDKGLVEAITTKIRLGSLGIYYKTDKSFEENLTHPLLQAAFLSAVKEARPERFGV